MFILDHVSNLASGLALSQMSNMILEGVVFDNCSSDIGYIYLIKFKN